MARFNSIDVESVQAGFALAPSVATVDVWQSMDPSVPFSLQSTGINNFNALTNQIGLFNGIGLQNQLGSDFCLGARTGLGLEANAQPTYEGAAIDTTLSSPLGSLAGNWTYNGSTICAPCPSDQKAKTNVINLEKSLDKVLSLRGVSFNWNPEVVPDKSSKQQVSIGLIAQEVDQVVPEVVVTETIEGQQLKTVEYGNLTALLIEAIKEQQEQINSLKQTVEELSTKLAGCCS